MFIAGIFDVAFPATSFAFDTGLSESAIRSITILPDDLRFEFDTLLTCSVKSVVGIYTGEILYDLLLLMLQYRKTLNGYFDFIYNHKMSDSGASSNDNDIFTKYPVAAKQYVDMDTENSTDLIRYKMGRVTNFIADNIENAVRSQRELKE